MCTVVIEEKLRIPDSIGDLDGFNKWACSGGMPEKARCMYLQGEVWVDMSPEEIFTHNQLKSAFYVALSVLIDKQQLGRFFPDGCLLANRKADLSTEPDGMFACWDTLKSAKLRPIRGRHGHIRFVGRPDMVLEVVSHSTLRKDTVKLREAYWEAGIPEYWLVDGRGEALRFDILRHTRNGYVASRKVSGWVRSGVFGESFRVTAVDDEMGLPRYTVLIRADDR